MSDDELVPEVRARYIVGYLHFVPHAPKRGHAEAAAEFNRWLAEHDRIVAGAAWDEGRAAESQFMTDVRAERRGGPLAVWVGNPYGIEESSSRPCAEANTVPGTVRNRHREGDMP